LTGLWRLVKAIFELCDPNYAKASFLENQIPQRNHCSAGFPARIRNRREKAQKTQKFMKLKNVVEQQANEETKDGNLPLNNEAQASHLRLHFCDDTSELAAGRDACWTPWYRCRTQYTTRDPACNRQVMHRP
jgi:hypothetical protein